MAGRAAAAGRADRPVLQLRPRDADSKDGKIINPFANGDAGHYLRVEGKGDRQEWVLAEAQGPGYVSRIWSANPDGELRIYIDGSPTPALAAPFRGDHQRRDRAFRRPLRP